MLLKDIVRITDGGFALLRTKAGELIAGQKFREEKSVVEIHGWVTAVCRERGKIVPGTHREGHNVWTTTGREYLPLLMTIEAGGNAYRNDRMGYIGVGIGSQLEVPGVTALITPIAWNIGGDFLAPLDPSTFPLNPSRTTVAYKRRFGENEITVSTSRVDITELGLFTNGSPSQSYTPGTRDVTLAEAGNQAPAAYKALEPVGKTNAMEFEVSWEIRF